MPKLPSYRNQSIALLCKSIDGNMMETLAFNEKKAFVAIIQFTENIKKQL